MYRVLITGITVCILAFAGGIASFIRYRYTRPDTRDIKLIVSVTIAVVAIFSIVALTLPQLTVPELGTSHTTSISASNAHNPRSSVGSAIVKIATDLPVSGADQAGGKLVQNGAKLAVEEANQNHEVAGVTFIFDPKDDVGLGGTGDPTVGAHNVTEFVADAEVAGIVGPFDSSVAKAEMPITNQAPVAQISPANTDPCLTKDTAASGCSGANNLRPTGKVNYFRVVTTDDNQGPAGADYMAKLGYKKVYVIDDAETYGMGNANAFIGEWQKLGGTVLGHASEPGTTTSYASLLMQIASSHPDLIYFGGIDSTGGMLIRQQMQQVPGLQILPFASDDGIVTPAFASTIQPLGGGDSYATVAVVDMATNPATANFRQQYAAVFPNEPVSLESAAAYDSANILIQAIKMAIQNGAKPPTSSSDSADAITFRTAVISAVQSISYDGVTGHQSFDSNGDTQLKTISIYKLDLNSSHNPDWIDATAISVA